MFIGLKISKENLASIKKFQEDVGLSYPVKEEDIHCTLLTTNDNFDYFIEEEFSPIEINNFQLEKIKTQTGVDCLAVCFENERLQEKYDKIIKQYNVKPLYLKLKLHITLSYDCGNFEIGKVLINPYLEKISFIKEYKECLKFEINRRLKGRN